MRRGFDGLKMLAEQVVGVDPLGGHLFVFCGRRADRVKILYWGVSRM
jgi:transposase